MWLPLQIALGLAYLIALVGLFLYGGNAYVMLATHWLRRRRAGEAPPPPPPREWPPVTVQLPLYNERYVARRLLEAVGALDYPRDRLEIQILDDSTDETVEIVAAAALRLTAAGLRVSHVRRGTRAGFKAGALAEGLARARGEFIAVFDADFVPPPDFLRRTVPHFADPRVALVQSRWGHLNRDFSLLTQAQSLGIDGHFGVEQAARAWGGLFLNFNGTAGVWRRAAIEDAGGWTHDTLTEDLDLSYRAQLRGWRIVYLPDVVCPAELPVLISGFKSQQRRWAKGSIQTALKLLPRLLRAPLPAWTKYQAFVHLTYYLIHPLMLTVVLLSVPLLGLGDLRPAGAALLAVGLVFGLATFGPASMLVYAQAVLDPAWRRRIWRLPTIMMIGVGVAWSTSLAVLQAFGDRRAGEFVRTPKFGIGPQGGDWLGKGYGDRRAWGGLVELLLGAYCAWTAWLHWRSGEYGVVPFLLLYTSGFIAVGTLSVLHARGAGPRLRPRASYRVALAAAALAVLVLPCPAYAEAADPVAAGERLWTASPDPRSPAACAACHDPDEARGWPGSFPKWRPLPPPAGRVMTLLQASAEAVGRHYPGADAREAALAITAYLTARSAGQPVTPGRAPGQPVFARRMRALRQSAARGRGLWEERCAACHEGEAAAGALAGWRRWKAPELFLESHAPPDAPLPWDAPQTADLLAYLVGLRAGRPVLFEPRPEVVR
jgi:cellulose synthase/poly-beta-1,6-N-acetylglucosamine synthase-like glycosyltransferase